MPTPNIYAFNVYALCGEVHRPLGEIRLAKRDTEVTEDGVVRVRPTRLVAVARSYAAELHDAETLVITTEKRA